MISRYKNGGETDDLEGKFGWFEPISFQKDSSDIVFTVTKEFVGKLWLIAEHMYGDSRYWWFIAMYNDIIDPIGDTYEGLELILPTAARFKSLIK